MDDVEIRTISFVVRIEVERPDDRREAARWRGYVDHVPSGARRYFESLSALVDFIASYLGAKRT